MPPQRLLALMARLRELSVAVDDVRVELAGLAADISTSHTGADGTPPGNELPEYLTVPQLQQHLNIGKSLAYDLARRHGVKFGRLLRVPRTALADFLPSSRNGRP